MLNDCMEKQKILGDCNKKVSSLHSAVIYATQNVQPYRNNLIKFGKILNQAFWSDKVDPVEFKVVVDSFFDIYQGAERLLKKQDVHLKHLKGWDNPESGKCI
jgi:hypothetical protein